MNKITKSFLMLLLLGAGAVSAQAQEKPDAWFNANHFRAKDYVDHVSPTEEEKDNWADICQNWEKTVPRWVTEEDGNGCIAITTNNWGGQNHHSQFWIKAAPLGLKEGATFHLHFRVKADKAQQIDGQAHYFFDYLTWNNPVGNIDVTNEWQEVDKDVTVAANQAGMTDVCFNLTREAVGSNTIYFDDIEVTNLDNKGEWAEKAPGWAGKLGYAHMQTTWSGEPASDANKSCASTPAKLVYSEENEDAYLEVVADPKTVNVWDNQFFIQIADANEKNKGKLNQNDVVKLTFWAMAVLDKESTSTATEFECGGGVHKSNDGNGYLTGADNVKIKVGEWTKLTLNFNIKDPQITNYAFNLSNDSKPITYRFKDFVAEFTQGNEDWYLNNVIVAKDYSKGTETYENGKTFPAAPYKVGKGEEGGYVEVKSNLKDGNNDYGSQIFFQIPEKLVGKTVDITMKVKASKEVQVAAGLHTSNNGQGWTPHAVDGIKFGTEWTEVSVRVNTEAFSQGSNEYDAQNNYVLNLSADAEEAIVYDFDELAFDEYVEWGDLVEVPVEGTVIAEKDWTKETSYSYWSASMPEGCTRTIENGIVVENTKTDGDPWANQMFTLDGLTFAEGKEYVLRYTLKINGEGDIRADVGPWGTNLVKAPDTQTLENGYRQVVFGIGPCAQEYTGAHAIWQSRKFVGKIIIEKVELFDVTPDYAGMDWAEDNLVTNGDLEDEDMDAFVAKIATEDDDDPQILPVEAEDLGKFAASQASLWPEGTEDIPDGAKGIYINALKQSENGSADETQLWVRLNEVLPAGTLYKVEFDVMSTNITEIPTQIDMNPGTNVSKDGIAKGASGSTPVKVAAAGKYVHYVNYCKAPEGGVGSIAFNLAGDKDYRYWFDNFSVKVLDDEEVAQAIEDANKDVDEALWDATLDLNVAVNAAKVVDTDGYSEESVKALEEAAKAGRELLDKADATKDALAAAAEDIEDAIAGLEYPYVEMPELDGSYIEIAQAQPTDFSIAATEAGEYNGDAYTTYTSPADVNVAFKMTDVDVTGCDKIYVYFAQPLKAGWNIAFWGIAGPAGVKAVDAGTEFIEFDLTEKLGDTEATYEQDGKTILKEVTLIDLWGATHPLTAKVYGVYKHEVAAPLADCDLTADMFFTWDAVDATAKTTGQPGCAYDINKSTGMPYGDGTVNEYNYADLSGFDHLAITATEGEPRLLFNRAAQDDHQGPLSVELPRDYGQNKYEAVVDNGDGSKTFVINLKEIVAKDGYAHLHAIKGANWANTTVTEMKLFVGESEYTDVLTAIEEVAEDAAVKDGKYFIDGQIVIVKNGVKYNAAGVVIQ